MNKTAICLIIVFLIVISIISYLLLSPCPDGKEKKGFKCVDKAAASTSSMQRPKLVGVASGCTSATPFRNEGICVASCPLGKVADSNGFCICSVQGQVADSNGVCRVPRQIIPLGGKNADCPQSHPLKEYGTCVSACAPGLFKSGNNCVPVCTPGTVLDIDPEYGPICRSSCLSTRPYIDLSNGVTPVCISSCPSSRPLNTTTLRCQSCSSRSPSLLNSNGQCLQAGSACPAGTYRNDISMCMPINPLSTININNIARVSTGNNFGNMTDGNLDTFYQPTSTGATWVYFPNAVPAGKKLYGFTIKFSSVGSGNNQFRLYRNMTIPATGVSISDSNFANIFYESQIFTTANNTIRHVFSSEGITTTNLALRFNTQTNIHEFEVTIR